MPLCTLVQRVIALLFTSYYLRIFLNYRNAEINEIYFKFNRYSVVWIYEYRKIF